MKTLTIIWVTTMYCFALFGLAAMVYDAGQRHWALGVMVAWIFGTPTIAIPFIIYREVKQ